MKPLTLDNLLRDITKNPAVLKIANEATNNMFSNPMLAQLEEVTLKRMSESMGPNGGAMMQGILNRINSLIADLPEFVFDPYQEVRESVGLEEKEAAFAKENAKKHTSFRPGEVWYDDEGNRIQAHGGTMFIEGDTYYWIGENKDHTTKEGRIWTWGVKIYSSKDLYNWHDEGFLVDAVLDDDKSLFYPVRRLDRPHMIFNKKTGKYVLWLKYCDEAHFTVLTSSKLLGPYEVVKGVYRPFDNRPVGDFDLAVDEKTGKGYLYCEVEHEDVWGAELNEEYTEITDNRKCIYDHVMPPLTREAVTHVKVGDKHYIFTSGMSGYIPNPSEVAVSDDYLGDYEVLGDPNVNDLTKSSFMSQFSCIFKVIGENRYIAMSDRWVPELEMSAEKYEAMYRVIRSRYDESIKPSDDDRKLFASMPFGGSNNSSISTYVWLPIDFGEEMPKIHFLKEWTL
ncbi:MAG: family 43 glycosylhydrolase [Bacilli bacterium]|nr:family 43 glycosylhydrolase [Bacilli bacterium]